MLPEPGNNYSKVDSLQLVIQGIKNNNNKTNQTKLTVY